MKSRYLGLALIPILGSCSTNQDKVNTQVKVIDNIESHIILPTHQLLCERVIDLQAAVARIEIGDDLSLLQAREAWFEARELWEQAEGYYVDDLHAAAIRSRMDKRLMFASNDMDSGAQLGELQLIEEILWGSEGVKVSAEMTDAELQGLMTITTSMVEQSKQLLALAREASSDVSTLRARGDEERTIGCQKRLKGYVERMITVTDEIIDEKIADNYLHPENTTLENPYSDNIKFDILNNLISIENLYTGKLDLHKGLGISTVVGHQDSELDAKVRKSIEESKKAINALPESYTMALIHDRDAVLVAKVKLQLLQELLKVQLLPIVAQI
ncbi:imelysin family protein [Sphingobacterium sp. SYP-B4668]|uniref:imelysin family protein n=1 Tax=Sphingobacterium sp. SYP-B4668 TaxID=2996035 RepID=UPI0022DD1F34|nr:imelysin family protein [Sphingobacterium sp. SYP-B4668]